MGMAPGPQIAQTAPASVVTSEVGTKVPGGVDLTGAPVRRRHGGGRYCRRCFGMESVSFTQGARWFWVRPSKGLGALERGRLGLSGSGSAGVTGVLTPGLDQMRGKMMTSQ